MTDIQGSVMEMKLYHGKKIMEWRRWFISPVFVIIVILCGTITMLDVCSSDLFLSDLKTGYRDNVIYYYLLNIGMFCVAGYCLAACTGAVLYAADYEENSVYMRINRMGVNRYVISKVMQTITGAFVCGFAAILICFFEIAVFYHAPLFPKSAEELMGTTDNLLLHAGRYKEYIFTLAVISGLCYAFYSLMTLFISIFVPNKKLVIAFPMILWFIFQYIWIRIPFLPSFMKPSLIFDSTMQFGDLYNMSPYITVLIIFAEISVIAVVVSLVFRFKLRRSGVFGGVEDE